MEIINENYILIILEYNKKKSKPPLDSFYISLMGDKEYHKILEENAGLKKKKRNFTIFDIPKKINQEFLATNKGANLDKDTKFLYPLDFCQIKRVVNTETGYSNTSPGIVVLYSYMGPITLIEDFIRIIQKKFDDWNQNSKDNKIFSHIQKYKILLCAEFEDISEIVNHNFFIAHFENRDKNADPNDFRRPLLGIKKSEDLFSPVQKMIPAAIKNDFMRRVKSVDSSIQLDENTKFAYPIDFSIIKRPVVLYTDENGIKNISNTSSGVNIIYSYMGPITLVDTFKEAFQDVFGRIKDDFKVFNKANKPLLLIGAELEEFKDFYN